MKRIFIIIAVAVIILAAVVVLLVMNPGSTGMPETTGSSDAGTTGNPTQPSSAVSTSLPATVPATTPVTAPAATAPQVTTPVIGANEKIGTLYTRAELDAMDNTLQTFWPDATEGKRPLRITTMQRDNKDHNVHFMGDKASVAYLTFNCDDEQFTTDSAGDPISYTTIVLNILKNSSVKATFFVSGKFCYNYPETVQRIIDEGHILGNYGLSSIELPGLSTEEMAAQITALHDYVQANFGYTMKYFRPYNGTFSQRTFAMANSLGYTTVLYSAAYTDKNLEAQMNDDMALDKIVDQIHQGMVIRFHAVSPNTVAILSDVIGILRDEQYRIPLFKP